MKAERPGQREFAQGVKNLQRQNFDGFTFCRICPLNRVGFDDDGKEIPLEAHHATTPYSVDRNQDPNVGILACRAGHRDQIHSRDNGLTRLGVLLMRLVRENPKTDRYQLGNKCLYKSKPQA